MFTKRLTAVIAACAMALAACAGGSASQKTKGASSATPVKMERIRAIVPTTMAFGAPMTGFGTEGNLKSFSSKVSVKNWDSLEQLKSSLMKNEAEVAATPAYVAANLYNKGVDVRFVGPVVWGMLYVLGPSGAPTGDWKSLKGKKVAVTMPGNMPDLVFSYLLKKNGLSKSDIEVVQAQDGQQAIQLLATGRAEYAILPEHAATLAETKLAQQGKTVTRALNLQEEWAKATGKKARFPMAGLVVPGKVADANPALIPAVRKEVAATIAKANAGDEQTLQKIADHYKLPVGVVKQVIPRLQLDMAPAAQTRSEYEDFLKRIGEGNPAIYGGKLPDAKFYAK